MWTPDEGSNSPDYVAVAITVTCEITSFTVANTPGDQTYTILDPLQVIDLTGITFTQDPNCLYTYTSSFGFTNSGSVSYIAPGTGIVPSVEVYSTDLDDIGS